MTDPDRMQPVLRRLHELGTGLSIDDFGTGYSSLSHLRRLPVDEVKIDKEFVFRMGTDLGDLAIVRAIVELGPQPRPAGGRRGRGGRAGPRPAGRQRLRRDPGLPGQPGADPDRLDAWLAARTAIQPGLPGVKGRRLQLLTG